MKKVIYLLVLILICLNCVSVAQNGEPEKTSKMGATQKVNEMPYYYQRMRKYHQRSASLVPAGATLFIGDSIMQGLCVAAVCDKAVNYGIGSDTTKGVLARVGDYHFDHVEAVVLAIGINDFKYRKASETAANLKSIISKIPKHVIVLVSEVLPVDERVVSDGKNKKIDELNRLYAGIARSDTRVFFLKHKTYLIDASSNLRKQLHVGDGVHLNNEGNRIWAMRLRKGLVAGKKLTK